MNNLIIGISGVARSGKDTFAALLKKELEERQYISLDYRGGIHLKALAHQLKKDSDDECIALYNISAFTQIKEEKDVIRPFLVAYGKRLRESSQGTYWTSKVDEEINALSGSAIIMVTDIRYCVYENDEVEWLKRKRGLLVHVSRYDGGVENKILPPNEDEAFNDPILEALADYKVIWPTTDNINIRSLFVREFIRKYNGRISSFI